MIEGVKISDFDLAALQQWRKIKNRTIFPADCSQSQKINFQFESYMYWNKPHCFGDEFIVHESLS